ncbi:MAG: ComEA family DNA-binding protein [Planctomycetota bacterium]
MTHDTVSSRLDQERVRVWLRGCVLVGAVGFAAVLMLAADVHRMHQRPFLNAAAERINPNTASVASLVRLPGIGRARALDIVHYRDHQQQDGPAFGLPQDMENIKGIGPKTAQNISPWLTFE